MIRKKLKAELIGKKAAYKVAADLNMKPSRFSAIVHGLSISQKVMEDISGYFGKSPEKLFNEYKPQGDKK